MPRMRKVGNVGMSDQFRYRLQRKEPYSMPCVIGNCSYPLPTYRWKDIAVSSDRAALESGITDWDNYRVIDTQQNEQEER